MLNDLKFLGHCSCTLPPGFVSNSLIVLTDAINIHTEAFEVINNKLRSMQICLDDFSEELSKAREEALFLKRDMDILWAEIKKKPLIIRLFYWWI